MNIPNVNPARGRGMGNEGKRRGFDAQDNGSIWALDWVMRLPGRELHV